MYTLFPSMFPRMGFGYTQVHWVFGLDQGLQDGMRQLPSCGIELIETHVFQLGFAQGYKFYIKECKETKQTWKKTTNRTKMFPKL